MCSASFIVLGWVLCKVLQHVPLTNSLSLHCMANNVLSFDLQLVVSAFVSVKWGVYIFCLLLFLHVCHARRWWTKCQDTCDICVPNTSPTADTTSFCATRMYVCWLACQSIQNLCSIKSLDLNFTIFGLRHRWQPGWPSWTDTGTTIPWRLWRAEPTANRCVLALSSELASFETLSTQEC